jgi:hypothetical protein
LAGGEALDVAEEVLGIGEVHIGVGGQGLAIECEAHESSNVFDAVNDVDDGFHGIEDGGVDGAPVADCESAAEFRWKRNVIFLDGHEVRGLGFVDAFEGGTEVADGGGLGVGVFGECVENEAAEDLVALGDGASAEGIVGGDDVEAVVEDEEEDGCGVEESLVLEIRHGSGSRSEFCAWEYSTRNQAGSIESFVAEGGIGIDECRREGQNA